MLCTNSSVHVHALERSCLEFPPFSTWPSPSGTSSQQSTNRIAIILGSTRSFLEPVLRSVSMGIPLLSSSVGFLSKDSLRSVQRCVVRFTSAMAAASDDAIAIAAEAAALVRRASADDDAAAAVDLADELQTSTRDAAYVLRPADVRDGAKDEFR